MHEKHQSQLQKSQQQQLACYELNVSHSSLLATQLKFQRFSGDTCSSSKKSNPIARGSQHLSECHNRPAGRGGPLWQPTGRKCLSSLTMRPRRRHSGFVCFHSCTEHFIRTHIYSFIHSFIGCSVCSFAHPFAPKYLSCAFRNWLLDTSEVTATAYPRSHCQVFAENLRLLCRVYFTLDLRTTRTCLFSLANSGPAITLTFMMYAHVCAHRTAARATR